MIIYIIISNNSTDRLPKTLGSFLYYSTGFINDRDVKLGSRHLWVSSTTVCGTSGFGK